MIHGKTLTVAITAYQEMHPGRNRGGFITRCMEHIRNDQRVDEIAITNDASSDYLELHSLLRPFPKVKLFQNEHNLGVWGNKIEAVLNSTGDWVIQCDSDNQLDSGYIDALESCPLDPETRYSPARALPQFDYTHLSGLYDTGNIHDILDEPLFECAMNTGNQAMHRATFAEVFEQYRRKPPHLTLPNYLAVPAIQLENDGGKWREVYNACDSFMFNLLWLLEGYAVELVRNMEYQHFYTNSPLSNYARAPAEKCDLSRAMKEYLRRATCSQRSA